MRRIAASFAFASVTVALFACGGAEPKPAPVTPTAVAPGGGEPYVMASASAEPTPPPSAAPVASSATPPEPTVDGPKVGEAAPALVATASNGTKIDLAKLKGKHVVVYFYPKDDTPGCTKEACAFRDAWAKYQKDGVQVIGVSEDDDKSHQEFTKKHKLPFPLLADKDGKIAKAFGVPVKEGYAMRVTYLIGPDGKVKKVYPKVDPGVHSDEILADVKAK
jgi:peroxiredoxin Q/BCP